MNLKEIGNKLEMNAEAFTLEALSKYTLSMPSLFKEEDGKNIYQKEIKTYSIGCELYYRLTKRKYNKEDISRIREVKKPGIYQFLEATLQDDIELIVSDEDYLKSLLNLVKTDIEKFDERLSEYATVDRYSTVGLVREINQDSLQIFHQDDLTILIVADGVGGGEEGEIASQKASQEALNILKKYNYQRKTSKEIQAHLSRAIMNANSTVVSYAKSKNIDKIGTTLSIALIYQNSLYIGHVGDSRIYRSSYNQRPKLITEDHSYPEVLFRRGEIKEFEKKDYKKNILVYVIGKEDLQKKDIYIKQEPDLNKEDKLFLCSDGVWDYFEGQEERFNSDNIEKDIKQFLFDAVPADNATFIRYHCKDVMEIAMPIDNSIKSFSNMSDHSLYKKFFWAAGGLLIILFLWLGVNEIMTPVENNETNTSSAKPFSKQEINTSHAVEPVNNAGIDTSHAVEPVNNKGIDIPHAEAANNEGIDTSHAVEPVNNKGIDIPHAEAANNEGIDTPRVKLPKLEEVKAFIPINKNSYHKRYNPSTKYRKKANNTRIFSSKITSNFIRKKDNTVILELGKRKIYFYQDKINSYKDCFKPVDAKRYKCEVSGILTNGSIKKYNEQLSEEQFFQEIRLAQYKKNKIHIVVELNKGYKQNRNKGKKKYSGRKILVFEKKQGQLKTISEKEKKSSFHVNKKKVTYKKYNELLIEDWYDSDLLIIKNEKIMTFKKDRVTMYRGDCQEKKNNWECVFNTDINKYKNNFQKFLKYQKFAKQIKLNCQKKKGRIVFYLKDGYRGRRINKNNKVVVFFK